MALLQNCLNLSGQEEEGEDGIKVVNLSVLPLWSAIFRCVSISCTYTSIYNRPDLSQNHH